MDLYGLLWIFATGFTDNYSEMHGDLRQRPPSPGPLPSREGREKPSPLAGEGRVRGIFTGTV